MLAQALRAFAAQETEDGEPTLDAELGSLALAEFAILGRVFMMGILKLLGK
ncbi:MAG: hypothetical protein ACPHCN_06530 [Mycobacterium sp.]